MELQIILQENVKRLRADLGLSQEELAGLCEIDRTYMSGIERGLRNPSIKIVGKLAKALKVKPHELLMPQGK